MKVSRPPRSRLILWALSFVLVFQGVSLAAQEGSTSIPVSLAPSSIVAGEPWRQDVSLSVVSADREIVVLTGTNDHLLIGYLPAASAGSNPIATVLGSHAEAIGPLTDIDTRAGYALQWAEIDGVPYGMFSVIFANRTPGVVEVHIYLSPASTFNTGLASAQENVTIGGRPAFLAVNARTLQAMVVRETGPGDAVRDASLPPPLRAPIAPEPTPEPTVQPTVAPTAAATPPPQSESTPVSAVPATPAPTIAPTIVPTVVPTPTPTVPPPPTLPTGPVPTMAIGPTPTPTPDSAISVSEIVPGLGTTPEPDIAATPDIPTERPGIDVSMYQDVGVQEDGHYISPQFGTEIHWDARWTILQTGDHSAVRSNSVTRTDTLTLMSTQYPDVVVVISMMSSYEFGFSDWRVAMEARDKNDFPDVFSSMQAESGVVVLESRNGLEVYMYDLSTSPDGSVFRETEVRTIPRLTSESVEAVTGGIQIDAAPLFPDVDPEEIEKAVF